MEQIARNPSDCEEGFRTGRRILIIDIGRDAKSPPRFKSILAGSCIEILPTSYLVPNMNEYTERFVKSIKSECLDQTISLGRESLVRAIADYAAHYHGERSHRSIENELINGTAPQRDGSIEVRLRLGGLLEYYHRRAT